MRAGKSGRLTSSISRTEGQELNTELTKDTETTERKVTSNEMKGSEKQIPRSARNDNFGVGQKERKSPV
jgi:hypothetical protein